MKKNISFLILIVSILVFYSASEYGKYLEQKSIDENSCYSIGKVYKIISKRSSTKLYYKYFFDNLEYTAYKPIDFNGDEFNNKFYRIELSTENPFYSKIFLDQEIADSTEIIKVGFELN